MADLKRWARDAPDESEADAEARYWQVYQLLAAEIDDVEVAIEALPEKPSAEELLASLEGLPVQLQSLLVEIPDMWALTVADALAFDAQIATPTTRQIHAWLFGLGKVL